MNVVKDFLDISVVDTRMHNPVAEIPMWKRALDLTCIFLALPALVPLMSGIAILIKLISRGPVFFRQERIGFRGQKFVCIKFRSMRVNADTHVHKALLTQLIQSDTPMTKMDSRGDSRLIPMGRLLRASGLDELPQLINVMRGEMSIVGPRPCTAYEYEHYLPWHRQRFDTLPGLTGLWQVSGKNKTTFTEMMNMDIQYAHQKSLALDLKIMSKTFSTLVSQIVELKKQ